MRDSSRNKPRSSSRRFGFWFGVAVVLHAELILLVGVGIYMFAPRDADLARAMAGRGGTESIEGGMLDEDAERKAEEAKKDENSLKAPGQVVDLPTPREEKRPDDARFVSEHDSSVEHETRKYGRFEDNARQGNQNGSASVSRPAQPSGDGRLAMRTPDLGKFLRGPGTPGPAARAGHPGSAFGAPAPRHPGAARRAAAPVRRSCRARSSSRARSAAGPRTTCATSTTATRRRSTPSAGGSRPSSIASSARAPSTGIRTRSTGSGTRLVPCTGGAIATPSCASS